MVEDGAEYGAFLLVLQGKIFTGGLTGSQQSISYILLCSNAKLCIPLSITRVEQTKPELYTTKVNLFGGKVIILVQKRKSLKHSRCPTHYTQPSLNSAFRKSSIVCALSIQVAFAGVQQVDR